MIPKIGIPHERAGGEGDRSQEIRGCAGIRTSASWIPRLGLRFDNRVTRYLISQTGREKEWGKMT